MDVGGTNLTKGWFLSFFLLSLFLKKKKTDSSQFKYAIDITFSVPGFVFTLVTPVRYYF